VAQLKPYKRVSKF